MRATAGRSAQTTTDATSVDGPRNLASLQTPFDREAARGCKRIAGHRVQAALTYSGRDYWRIRRTDPKPVHAPESASSRRQSAVPNRYIGADT